MTKAEVEREKGQVGARNDRASKKNYLEEIIVMIMISRLVVFV